MRVQNLKKVLLLCSVMGAASNVSWGVTSFIESAGGFAGGTIPNYYGVIAATSGVGTFTTAPTASTGTANTTTLAVINDQYGITYDTINSPLNTAQDATHNVTLQLLGSGPSTFAGPVEVHAPIVSSGGGNLVFTGASPVVTALSTLVPASYADMTAYYVANPLYKASTAATPATLPALIDVKKSMSLDLTGILADYIFPLDLALQEGQTLTITLPASGTSVFDFTGVLRGTGNIIVTGYGTAKFSASSPDFDGTITRTGTNANVYLPPLNFSSNAFTSDISVAAGFTQVVELSGANAVSGYTWSGKVTGAGNVLIKSTAQRAIHMTEDNSSWTGALAIGDGTATFGPEIHVDSATALGAAGATGAITVAAGMTASVPSIIFNASATTARPIVLTAAANTTAALDIWTRVGMTSVLNGVISGTPAGGGLGLRIFDDGTTKLMAANTHTGTGYGTYINPGAKVVMGTATSLGASAVLASENSVITPPNATGTIANAILLGGNVTIDAPTTAGLTTTFSGIFSGLGSLKRGAGLGGWNFTAANTYSGGFTVPSGLTSVPLTVGVTSVAGTSSAFGNGTVTFSSPTTVTNAGAFDWNNKAMAVNAALTLLDAGYSYSIPAPISGTGQITQGVKGTNTGVVTYTPASDSTFTKSLIVLGGTAKAGATVDSTGYYPLGATGKIILGSAATTATGQSAAFAYSDGKTVTNTTDKVAMTLTVAS